MNSRWILKATNVSFVLWWTDITAAGILGYLAAITLRAAAAERDRIWHAHAHGFIEALIWNDKGYSVHRRICATEEHMLRAQYNDW